MSKSAQAWAALDGDRLFSTDFFRTRASAQIFVGRRSMGGSEYRNALLVAGIPANVGDVEEFSYFAPRAAKHVWRAVKKRYPAMRLVRVKVVLP
jgi:hypothetical protein